MWKKAQNPVFQGILPPKPVDNHVDNVDFCIGMHCIFSVYHTFFTPMLYELTKPAAAV